MKKIIDKDIQNVHLFEQLQTCLSRNESDLFFLKKINEVQRFSNKKTHHSQDTGLKFIR